MASLDLIIEFLDLVSDKFKNNVETNLYTVIFLAQLVGILHIICRGWGSNPKHPIFS